MKVLFLALFLAIQAHATITVTDYSGSRVGRFTDIECGANVACSDAGNHVLRLRQDSNIITVDGDDRQLAITECGSVVTNSEQGMATLPDASTQLGCEYTFIVGNASQFQIDTDGTDQIVLLTNSAGDMLWADAVGEAVTLVALSADVWAQKSDESGTWTDGD